MQQTIGRNPLYAKSYFKEVIAIASTIDTDQIDLLATELAVLRERGGRLFFLGVGGSAANCSHAVNDFRKLCGIEAYAPTDNVSELTARTNDEGWETVFAAWLQTSRANENDAIFVLSVGGGSVEPQVSMNIVRAVDEAKKRQMRIMGIVGRESGYARRFSDGVLVVPSVEPSRVTPHTEEFQSVVLHCLVSHPALQQVSTKW